MSRFATASIFVAALSVSTLALAAPTLDGTITSSDGYGAPVATISGSYVNGSDASGGTNNISLYFTYDANNIYGAVHLDSGSPSPFSPNIYFYSGSAGTHTSGPLAGTPGSYGDGDDIIAEGTNGWGYATAAGGISGHASYDPSSVDYVYNGTDTAEFSIARSLIGNYDLYRFGGQLFGYEFHTGGDRIDGPLVSTPEPGVLGLAGIGGMMLMMRRRRRAI